VSGLLIRGARVISPGGDQPADIAIADGVVAAIGAGLEVDGAEVVDATGLVALPGVVDAHVHLDDPGRSEWEGFATGTRALAAGGTTTCVDMPLNALPPTIDGPSFDLKVRAAEGVAHVDVALWGGLVPGDVDRLDELAERGVVGFKAFMADSGTPEFEAADDLTLLEGMARAARLGLPVAVHAESNELTGRLAARAAAAGRTAMRDYLASRPVIAELEAIGRALAFAGETGCALHVVHVSTGRAVALIARARDAGVDVSCETCPHYLVLDEDDAVLLGAIAKCAPPLRPAADVDALWDELVAGCVDLVATDHSPCPPELKAGDDLLTAWGGIAGAQTLLALLWDAGVAAGRLAPPDLARLLSRAPAGRFGLAPGKGVLAPGADADLVLVDPAATWRIERHDLHDRHRLSPFAGQTLSGRVVRTILRGRTVALDGRPVGPPTGRVLRRGAGHEDHRGAAPIAPGARAPGTPP
jgi:allantoinase